MKPIALLLFAIAFPAGALAQASPWNPQPAPPETPQSTLPDNPTSAAAAGTPMWDRIEHLPRGQKVKIRFTGGRWERCEFGGATDAFLFCGPGEDSGRVQAFQVNRANISDFKIDHDERNGRLIFTGVTVGTGLWLGILAAHNSHGDPEAAGAFGGLLGSGLGALLGVPLSCLSGFCVSLPSIQEQPAIYGIQYNVPLRRFRHRSR